jgi:hypothetical protein
MTHDELLAICDNYSFKDSAEPVKALRAVVELHKPAIRNNGDTCECDVYDEYMMGYPCDTIKAIEKELR